MGRQLEELCRKNSEETELFSYAGWIFFMRREYAKAHSCLEKVYLTLDSQRANDWRRLAVVEGIQDPRSSRQWRFFEKALELDPSSYDTFFLRGIVFLGEGEYQKALDDFNRGIAIQDNFEIRGLRGLDTVERDRSPIRSRILSNISPGLQPCRSRFFLSVWQSVTHRTSNTHRHWRS